MSSVLTEWESVWIPFCRLCYWFRCKTLHSFWMSHFFYIYTDRKGFRCNNMWNNAHRYYRRASWSSERRFGLSPFYLNFRLSCTSKDNKWAVFLVPIKKAFFLDSGNEVALLWHKLLLLLLGARMLNLCTKCHHGMPSIWIGLRYKTYIPEQKCKLRKVSAKRHSQQKRMRKKRVANLSAGEGRLRASKKANNFSQL